MVKCKSRCSADVGAEQVESTVAIQALQPRVKEIQEKYKGRDPQEAQVWTLSHTEELPWVLKFVPGTYDLVANSSRECAGTECSLLHQKAELCLLAWHARHTCLEVYMCIKLGPPQASQQRGCKL